jgi:flagellar biosynthesis GTPase FlhF
VAALLAERSPERVGAVGEHTMTPVVAALATVIGVFAIVGGVVGVRRLARRASLRRIRRKLRRQQEAGVTSLEWVYRVRPAQEGGGRALPVDGEPRTEARRRPSEVLADAERRAAEIEERARRNAEATRIEAEREATVVIATAERRAIELEEGALRSTETARSEAESKASAILTTAERKAAEIEERGLARAEAALEEAEHKASEIVAQAERERIRLRHELAREETLVEETRKKLSALLESVLADVKDDSPQETSRISELREARDLRS